MEWLDVVYGAVAGGGVVKILDHIAKTLRDNRTDLIQAEEDLRIELRVENDSLRERNTHLEKERRECLHRLGSRDQTIVLLKWQVEKLGGSLPDDKETKI